MEYAVICLITFLGAGLTLFSGFGLGTILLPVFGLFFPIEIAVCMTAIVHLANNLIKLGMFFKKINRSLLAGFGIPSMLAAVAGAYLLKMLSHINPIFEYSAAGHLYQITPLKLIIACLLFVFSMIELIPALSNMQFERKWLPLGGLLSGFFGGLSGNQGALRTAFLIRTGMEKESFIATGVAIACIIDVSRISVYSNDMLRSLNSSQIPLLIASIFSAFSGVFIGNRYLKKMTLTSVRYFSALMLLVFAVLLGFGLI